MVFSPPSLTFNLTNLAPEQRRADRRPICPAALCLKIVMVPKAGLDLHRVLDRRTVVPDQLVQSRGDLPERAVLHGFDEFGKHIAAVLDHFA